MSNIDWCLKNCEHDVDGMIFHIGECPLVAPKSLNRVEKLEAQLKQKDEIIEKLEDDVAKHQQAAHYFQAIAECDQQQKIDKLEAENQGLRKGIEQALMFFKHTYNRGREIDLSEWIDIFNRLLNKGKNDE